MADFHLQCLDCGALRREDDYHIECPACGVGCLEVVLDTPMSERVFDASQPSIFRFHRLMPFDLEKTGAGTESFEPTPEFEDDALSTFAGATIVAKDETGMPTGTWKDREGFLSLYRMRRNGISDVVLFSSGNTGVSLARSASLFRGPTLHLIVPRASEQRARAALEPYDTGYVRLVLVDGSNDECIRAAKALSSERGFRYEGGFMNYARREGLKLLGLEHAFLSPHTVDWYAQPVAGGIGLYSFEKAYRDAGRASPRLLGVQAEICAPMVAAWQDGAPRLEPRHIPAEVVLSDFVRVLRTRDPGHGYSIVKRVLDRAGGAFEAASDAEILAALRAFYRSPRFVAAYRDRGLLVGLEAATALAGVARAVRGGIISRGSSILLNVSGAAKAGDVQLEWIRDLLS